MYDGRGKIEEGRVKKADVRYLRSED